MKIGSKRTLGITWIEVLVIVAMLSILLGIIIPTRNPSTAKAARLRCVTNLKQIGIAMRLFAYDHNNRFPSLTNDSVEAWIYIQQLSNELSAPKVLVCPSDIDRPKNGRAFPSDFTSMANEEPAMNNFSHPTHRDGSLSYFVGSDANETKPQMILTGDRNLTMEPLPSRNIWTLGTNSTVGWTEKMHYKSGNVGLADGSVRQMTNPKLTEHLHTTGDATNRIVMPR